MSKRIVLLILISVICAFPAAASGAENKGVACVVEGKALEFTEATGIPYLSDQGRTMMPLRECLTSIGCQVQWEQKNQRVISTKGTVKVELTIGEPMLYRNGVPVRTDTAAVLKNGRTYLPLRVVMEAYGYEVSWDGSTRTVAVSPGGGADVTATKPSQINGGTTGIFSRKQLGFYGFDGVEADVTLPYVTIGDKGDCPYVYFGFDWQDDKGNAEGGFQFMEDPNHPAYNKWVVFLRQGNDWDWGEALSVMEQGSTHNLKFYRAAGAEGKTDLVIALDGKEVVRKASSQGNFENASVKTVVAMAMSRAFDGTNCACKSMNAKVENVKVSTTSSERYADFGAYALYREWRENAKGGIWFGSAECVPGYLHYGEDGTVSIYKE